MISTSYVVEACVESLSQAMAAERNGADVIELCSDLSNDGLSPSIDLVRECIDKLHIPIKVMVRPRPGNFTCNEQELKQMIHEIAALKALGIRHFVAGILTERNSVDLNKMIRLSANVGTGEITFHKAIDLVQHWKEAILQLKSIHNIKYILTSGGTSTASNGIDQLQQMIHLSSPEITIIPAGSIDQNNLNALHHQLGASHYHGRKIVGSLSL